ncbi:MAG: hypothetical protein AB7G40_18570, partial [Hyphomonadaceae bacterium]
MRKSILAAVGLVLLASCERAPAAVDLDGRWRVQQIAGASLGEGVVIWLQIDPRAGEVSGFTG